MRFVVSRSSGVFQCPDDEGARPPCEGATPARVQYWDRRIVRSGVELDAAVPGVAPWLSEGERHRTWSNPDGLPGQREGIERLMWRLERVWVAEVPDVLAFVGRYGRCIVDGPGDYVLDGEDVPSIEIYDDYRE